MHACQVDEKHRSLGDLACRSRGRLLPSANTCILAKLSDLGYCPQAVPPNCATIRNNLLRWYRRIGINFFPFANYN